MMTSNACRALGANGRRRMSSFPTVRQATALRHPRDNTLSLRSGEKSGMSSHSSPAGSHHAIHHHEEVELWKKITGVGSIFVAGVFLNWLASDHQHMHTPPPYPYLRMRNKPLPWGDGTKDLLDTRHHYVDGHGGHH